MNKRNNGVTEHEILQNEFTAFITTSLERERLKYLKNASRRRGSIYIMSDNDLDHIPDDTDYSLDLCENDALERALKVLDERERYVLFARVLEEKSFEEIADALGLKYKGVAAVYYFVFKEKLSKKAFAGLCLMVAGTLLMVFFK